MSRIVYWQYLIDKQGNPLEFAEVRFYLAGTLEEADIYLNSTFGSVTKSSESDLKTDQFGFVQFWVGDEFEVEGGYTADQQFKIIWQNDVDSIQEEIDNLQIFAPVYPIDTTNSILTETDRDDFNRVISNKQGKRWNDHVDSIVPSASPHNLEPVEYFDLDPNQRKVISNKLGYQMYEMSRTASITPVDVSAARYYNEDVTSWTTSGGIYYKDITHNFNNYYPIVVLQKDNRELKPKRLETVNPNTTRVWLTENPNINVAVYG